MASSSIPTSFRKRDALRSAFTLTLMAGMAFVPSRAQFPSLDTACTRHYTVQEGDTCDKIGQETLTSTYQIMALNLPQSGPDCYNLQPGAQLCLGRYGNDCQMVYRATNSDTCESIAGQYGISVNTLLENNPTASCDQIYDGLVLCTLDGLVRPPADPKLHLNKNVPKPGDSQMPLGNVLVAKNSPLPVANTTASASTAQVSQSNPVADKQQKISAPKHHHFKHGAGSRHSHH